MGNTARLRQRGLVTPFRCAPITRKSAENHAQIVVFCKLVLDTFFESDIGVYHATLLHVPGGQDARTPAAKLTAIDPQKADSISSAATSGQTANPPLDTQGREARTRGNSQEMKTNGPADCSTSRQALTKVTCLGGNDGYTDCKSVCLFACSSRKSPQASPLRLRDHHQPDSRGTGKRRSPVAQTVAHPATSEPNHQKTLSWHQRLPTRVTGLWVTVLADLQSSEAARRQRSQGRARNQDSILEI